MWRPIYELDVIETIYDKKGYLLWSMYDPRDDSKLSDPLILILDTPRGREEELVYDTPEGRLKCIRIIMRGIEEDLKFKNQQLGVLLKSITLSMGNLDAAGSLLFNTLQDEEKK